jgi:hypothetical protein
MNARGRVGYEQVIKVSGTVTVTATTGGNTFQGITGLGAGAGSWFTPYANGTNYATLSQYGDFRLARISVRPVASVVGSTADSVNCIAALDSTGFDATNGGTATGAWNAIRSRQTSRTCYLSNARPQGPRWEFKPVEMNNRLWAPQNALSTTLAVYSSYQPAPGQLWGVVFSSYSATSSTVTLEIDWYFDVREPQLTGVLLGKESPEVLKRIQKLVGQQCPWLGQPDAPPPTDPGTSGAVMLMPAVRALAAESLPTCRCQKPSCSTVVLSP